MRIFKPGMHQPVASACLVSYNRFYICGCLYACLCILEVYRYGNFGFYRYRLYFCQNLPIPITDPILILHMSSNYSLYLACIKLDGLATNYHVAKLPQQFYTLKLVNYGNIYNCYSSLKLI